MTNIVHYKLRSVLAVLILVFSSACGNNTEGRVEQGVLSTTIALPEQLKDVRALVSPELALTVNGVAIEVTQDADTSRWIGTINVDQGKQHFLELKWLDQGLLLIEAQDWFSVPGDSPVNIVIEDYQYNSAFDFDGDGRSNLFELKGNTDPRNANDPEDALDTVIFNVELDVPDQLVQEQAIEPGNLVVRAILNEIGLLNQRDDGQFFGQRSVTADHPVFLTIEWCYRLASGDLFRLMRFARSVEIGGQNMFLPSPQNKYRTDYDRDSDGVTNIAEIALGTAPADNAGSNACN